jgi:hypothetical protein
LEFGVVVIIEKLLLETMRLFGRLYTEKKGEPDREKNK